MVDKFKIVWKETPKKSYPKPIDETLDKNYYSSNSTDQEDKTKLALNKGSLWFRANRYSIKEVPHTISKYGDTITTITKRIEPERDAIIEKYDPFTSLPPSKKINADIDGTQFWGPHIHLMRLDIESDGEILNFVHHWGLLGLWKEHGYKDLQPKVALAGKRKSWFEIEEHKKLSLQFDLRWGEPLEFFKQAVKDFQESVQTLIDSDPLLGGSEQIDANIEANIKFISMLQGVSPYVWINKGKGELCWKYDSLYKAIFLMTSLEWTAGKHGFRRCAHKPCGKYFQAKTNKDIYCSEACSGKQRRIKSYHVNEKPSKILKELLKQFPNLDLDWLKEQAFILKEQQGIGPKRAAKKIAALIELQERESEND